MLTLTSLGEILKHIFSTPFHAIRRCDSPRAASRFPPQWPQAAHLKKGLVFPCVLSRSSRATP